MKTLATLFLAVLAFGTLTATAAQRPASSDVLTASQVRQLIAGAQPADHARLRAHFEALSAQYTADAARHTALASAAGGNPNRTSSGAASAHHTELARLAKESAGITRELAAHHGQLAAGAASTAPRDSVGFEKGAGAPAIPSDTQLLELAAKARTPSEHGELVEYYESLVKQYSTAATEHAVMAAAYRGTKSGTSMASHCDRLVQIARQEVKEATALAAEHKRLATDPR
jgi:hypothetical protein